MALSVITPDYTDTVDQRFFIEPLGGPKHPQNYLDRFPEELYNTGLDSHLTKFLYSLLGPAGIGWLRKNNLQARIKLEEMGVELFDLDRFYANPLNFGRVLEELYDEDPAGLLSREEWDKLVSKDARYRSRALDYVRAARRGNTPEGMRLAARSGLGHECEVIEGYKALYDAKSDDPLGLEYFGTTGATPEFIVLPRREAAQSEIQRLTISGTPTGGSFTLDLNGVTTGSLAHDAPIYSNYDVTNPLSPVLLNLGVTDALEMLPGVGKGNVAVTGGPLPVEPIEIHFLGDLASRDIPKLRVSNALIGSGVGILVETVRGGVEAVDEVAVIPPRDQYHLTQALSHLKPQASVVTFREASGKSTRAIWNTVSGTSSFIEVVRYVTGRSDVPWPESSNRYWIKAAEEREARRIQDDLQHHYAAMHDVQAVRSYGIGAANHSNIDTLYDYHPTSDRRGPFDSYQAALYGPLSTALSADQVLDADRALADYAEPLTVTTQQESAIGDRGLINGVYPIEYQDLPNVPPVKYLGDQFWSSVDREDGTDYLEIDFGRVRAVNRITFETLRKPFDIQLEFDVLDLAPERRFVPVVPAPNLPFQNYMAYAASFTSPWANIELNFTDAHGQMIFTRSLRLKFVRRQDLNSPFFTANQVRPYSVDVRNLRAGRLVS